MGDPSLIGTTEPDGAYCARYLHWSAHPDELMPVLRHIWRDTFTGDTEAMATQLLSRDWSSISARPNSSVFPALVVPGIGSESPGGTGNLYRGRVASSSSGGMGWLYLLDTTADTVTVYEATCHERWLRHSIHHLHAVGELFVPVGPDGDLVCTACGAVNENDHHDVPSMAGYGRDTSTRCTRCGSTVTSDPVTGAHTTRADPTRPAT